MLCPPFLLLPFMFLCLSFISKAATASPVFMADTPKSKVRNE